MIKIVPNILSMSELEFAEQLAHLADFDVIDIDVAVSPFTKESTVSLKKAIDIIKNNKRLVSFHLMESNPKESIELIVSSGLDFEQIFVHQESNLSFTSLLNKALKEKIGITLKRESRVKELEFYKDYSSIQLMTGTFGGQGNEFDEQALAKSLELRDLGFDGEIGIDGGVNLNSAKDVKEYPIDRVSVGSFFHKSKNPLLDKMKLDLALNMKSVEESY